MEVCVRPSVHSLARSLTVTFSVIVWGTYAFCSFVLQCRREALPNGGRRSIIQQWIIVMMMMTVIIIIVIVQGKSA